MRPCLVTGLRLPGGRTAGEDDFDEPVRRTASFDDLVVVAGDVPEDVSDAASNAVSNDVARAAVPGRLRPSRRAAKSKWRQRRSCRSASGSVSRGREANHPSGGLCGSSGQRLQSWTRSAFPRFPRPSCGHTAHDSAEESDFRGESWRSRHLRGRRRRAGCDCGEQVSSARCHGCRSSGVCPGLQPQTQSRIPPAGPQLDPTRRR